METASVSLDRFIVRFRRAEERRADDAGWERKTTLTTGYVLWATVSGTGLLTTDIGKFRLSREVAHVLGPGRSFRVEPDPVRPLRLYAVRFDAAEETADGAIVPSNRFPLGCSLPCRSPEEVVALCDRLVLGQDAEDGIARFDVQIEFLRLIRLLAESAAAAGAASAPSRSGLANDGLERAKRYLERHFRERISIAALAELAGLRPKSFTDAFRRAYGMSPSDYLTDLRLSAAKRLMSRPDVLLKDVAHQVGYEDEFYFSRKFKQETGVCPTVYLKRRQHKIAAYRPAVTGHLLALNRIPYAAPLHPKWTAYYDRTIGGEIAVPLSAYRHHLDWEANIRRLEACALDLVVSPENLEPGEKELLSARLPVFWIPTADVDWQAQLLAVADALGEREEAERWIERDRQRVERARQRIRLESRGSVLVIRLYRSQMYPYFGKNVSELLFRDLGLTPALRPPAIGEQGAPLSPEQLVAVDPDVLFVLVCREDATIDQWNAIIRSEWWRSLQAVRNRNVVEIGSDPWLEYSAHARMRALEEAVRFLAGNHPCG